MARPVLLLSTLLLASLACDADSSSTAPTEASTDAPTDASADAPVPESSVADNSTPQVCEHARDRIVELSELDGRLAEQDAPDDQKATARERGQDIANGIREPFVDACLELEGRELQCMSKIDAYADPLLTAKRSALGCRARDPDPDPDPDPDSCEQAYADIDEIEQRFGSCHELVEELVGMAWARSRPEPKSGGVIGVMVQDGGDLLDSSHGGSFAAQDKDSDYGGRGLAVPQVLLGTAKVDGPLDQDLVRRIVRAHVMDVRDCYNAGLSKRPGLAGEVTVEFTINSEGRVVASAPVDPHDFADPQVPRCIAKAARRWRFPKPRGGGEVEVSHVFSLEPR